MKEKKISHLDDSGGLRMVDVSSKPDTLRRAAAEGRVLLGTKVAAALQENRTPKGNVLEAARLAGIMAAKKTSDLIPLCHPLNLDSVDLGFQLEGDVLQVRATMSARGPTGVEMEALVAVSIAALTVYDMLKVLSHDIIITDIHLVSKSGGQSGDWQPSEFPLSKRRGRGGS
jgi:cyclic pyranopterin monophosphate synthase